jgi:hypothetical protein
VKSLRFVCLFTIFVCAVAFAQNNPVPFVNQPLVPMTVKPGSGGFTLTVNGTGFATDAVVNWNGTPRTTEVISSSQLKAIINAADVAKAGTASLTVVNPGKPNRISSVANFLVRTASSTVALTLDPNLSSPGEVVVGDFNNDGKLDAVVADPQPNGSSGLIDLYFGKGDGSFKAPVQTSSSFGTYYLLSGDFNGDGKPDLLISPGVGFAAFITRNNGTFTQKQSFGGGDGGGPSAVGDFNGDGNLDVAYIGYSGDFYLAIYLGNGNGTFKLASDYDLGPDGGGTAAVGDFNGDGKLDLAIPVAYGSTMMVLLGNGDGTFQSPITYSTSYGGGAAVAADVNGDGILDLVTGAGSVLLGIGDGTFADAGGINLNGGTVSVGDFNGDGKLDLAAVSVDTSGAQHLMIAAGKGDGTFKNPIEFAAGTNFFSWTSFGVGDFNGDGKLDLIVSTTIDLFDFGNTLLFLQTSASLSPASLAFGNQNVGTKSKPQTVTFKNIGSDALKISGITITGADSKDFSQSNQCGTSLPPGVSCKINVTFAPKMAGSLTASLQVSDSAVGSPQAVSLSGTGVAAATVSLTPSKLPFPVQLVNTTSSPQTATLTNTGSTAVTISKISAATPFSETNNCPASLPTNTNCQIKVSFKPTAKGPASGKLSVTDDATGSPQTVALSGMGTVVNLSPIGVNFGDQKVGTKSAPVPVQLTNEGTTTLSITQIAIAGPDPNDFSQTNNCGSSVPAGGSCTIKVTFQPTTTGSRSAKLAVSDDGGGSPQEVPLGGPGT